MATETTLLLLVVAIVVNVLLLVAVVRHGLSTDDDRRRADAIEQKLLLSAERAIAAPPSRPRAESPRSGSLDVFALSRSAIVVQQGAAPVVSAVPPVSARRPASPIGPGSRVTPEPGAETEPDVTPDRALAHDEALAPKPALTSKPEADRTTPSTVGRPESRGRKAPATGSTRATRGGRGTRSRFTLPSIEVDHERTERVVLSLLSGDGEGSTGSRSGTAGGWEQLLGPEIGDRPGTVVAFALEGLDRVIATAGRDAAERLVTPILEALRRSARGTDRVALVGPGHFRVLLVEADELVAERFVSRVVGIVERRLAMSPSEVYLAAGWARSESAVHLERAVHEAEERRRIDAAARDRSEGAAPA